MKKTCLGAARPHEYVVMAFEILEPIANQIAQQDPDSKAHLEARVQAEADQLRESLKPQKKSFWKLFQQLSEQDDGSIPGCQRNNRP